MATACAVALLAAAPLGAGSRDTPQPLVRLQRYGMGTMFDVLVHHASEAAAERAAHAAWNEIDRLDGVLSSFKDDSDLSRLNREAHAVPIAVDQSLFDIVRASIAFSRQTGGRFDITVGPLVRLWKQAYAEGRRPSDDEIGAATACVGPEQIELLPPNRIRLRSRCVELDLGRIGKGYAVDRALEVLAAHGVRAALINAGGSSIGAIGAPPGQAGWPVRLGAEVSGTAVLLLRDGSMSTSQPRVRPFVASGGTFGAIVDPRSGAPVEEETTVTVVTRTGAAAEALTKALLMVRPGEATAWLAQFPDTAALWISPEGILSAAYGAPRLELAASR